MPIKIPSDLPAFNVLRNEGVMVMDDTCILMPEVYCGEVRREVETCRAGVFGYGKRWADQSGAGWHGTKGVYMIPHWCQEMSIILDITHVRRFRHADMRLKYLRRHGKAPRFSVAPDPGRL